MSEDFFCGLPPWQLFGVLDTAVGVVDGMHESNQLFHRVDLWGGGVKLENLWNNKAQINDNNKTNNHTSYPSSIRGSKQKSGAGERK